MWTVTAHFILPVQNLQVSICLRSIKAKAFHNFLYISMGLSARTTLYNFRNYHQDFAYLKFCFYIKFLIPIDVV